MSRLHETVIPGKIPGTTEIVDYSQRKEVEPFPNHKVIMLGGGHGTGLAIGRGLSMLGYEVYVGTRTKKNFESVKETFLSSDGREPKPFVADLTKDGQIQEAYASMNLQKGEPVHFFAYAGGGMESYFKKISEPIIELRRQLRRTGKIKTESFVKATEELKEIVTQPESQELAYQVNCNGPLELAQILKENGNLNEESVVSTLSSSMSDQINPYYDASIYLTHGPKLNEVYEIPSGEIIVPWFYYPIALSKETGVRELYALTLGTDSRFVNFITGDILGSDVSKLIKSLPLMQSINDTDLESTSITAEKVVIAILTNLITKDNSMPNRRKVYIPEDGIPTLTQPEQWKKRYLPYF